MNFESRYTLHIPIDQAWDFIQDLSQAASCMPGVEGLTAQGNDTYGATMRIRMGPVTLALQGKVKLRERDVAAHRLVMDLEGRERRLPGTAKGTVTVGLTEEVPGQTALNLEANYQIVGKLGELGQPIIRRKAESTLQEFVETMAKKAAASG